MFGETATGHYDALTRAVWLFYFLLKILMNEGFNMYLQQIMRGDIYYANLNPVIGSEQGDKRPVVILQNNLGNKHSPTTIIAPITRNLKKKKLPTHVIIPRISGLGVDSLVLVEQIRTIDRSRLGEYIGRISETVQMEIDSAIVVCVGIHEILQD